MHQVTGCESFPSVAMLSLDGRKALGELQLMSLVCGQHATHRRERASNQSFPNTLLVCILMTCQHDDVSELLLLTPNLNLLLLHAPYREFWHAWNARCGDIKTFCDVIEWWRIVTVLRASPVQGWAALPDSSPTARVRSAAENPGQSRRLGQLAGLPCAAVWNRAGGGCHFLQIAACSAASHHSRPVLCSQLA